MCSVGSLPASLLNLVLQSKVLRPGPVVGRYPNTQYSSGPGTLRNLLSSRIVPLACRVERTPPDFMRSPFNLGSHRFLHPLQHLCSPHHALQELMEEV